MSALNLDRPLRWRAYERDPAVRRLLEDLPGNILKSHGRDHVTLDFLRLADPEVTGRAATARALGGQATSALQQLLDSDARRNAHQTAPPFVSVSLTYTGFRSIGARPPEGERFKANLGAKSVELFGFPQEQWQPEYLDPSIHLLLVVADDDPDVLARRRDELFTLVRDHVEHMHVEHGDVHRNLQGEPVEHFGFVDGRSRPLPLQEDLERERDERGGDDPWSSELPLALAIARCPGSDPDVGFGSYLALCKLEQNVLEFGRQLTALAAALGRSTAEAGALIVGRFEDGTPLATRAQAEGRHPVPNNFNYDDDVNGDRCPAHAHCRKVNPRHFPDLVPPVGRADEDKVRILRRGVTYGRREVDAGTGRFLDAPAGGVGLLFMSYQSSLPLQFEHLLRTWARNAEFPPGAGVDALLADNAAPHYWPTGWDEPGRVECAIRSHVRPLGGCYFFTPPRSFFDRLLVPAP